MAKAFLIFAGSKEGATGTSSVEVAETLGRGIFGHCLLGLKCSLSSATNTAGSSFCSLYPGAICRAEHFRAKVSTATVPLASRTAVLTEKYDR